MFEKKKLVKPIALTLLPQEIKMIENTKKRKEFFIQIILPLLLKKITILNLIEKTLLAIIIKAIIQMQKKMARKKI